MKQPKPHYPRFLKQSKPHELNFIIMVTDYYPTRIGGKFYRNEKAWSMNRGTKTLTPEKVKYIILHCSATRADRPYTAADCERDHKARGFICGGYHIYVERDGKATAFRSFTEVGAHCKPFNSCSIGICYEGGLDANGDYANTMTPEQREVIHSYLVQLTAMFPNAKIRGHRDMPGATAKACPCFDIPEMFPEFYDFF